MELQGLIKLLEKYPNFTILDALIAGISIGSTQLNPSIIFRFLGEATHLLLTEEHKYNFFNFLLQNNLGKAKELLMPKEKLFIKKKISNDKAQVPIYPCKLCKNCIPEKEIEYLENCADLFHRQCLIANIEEQVQHRKFPIKCPECNGDLTQLEVKKRLSEDYYERHQRNEISYAVGPNINIVECPI